MRPARIAGIVGTAVIAALAIVVGADYLQIGRRVPEPAALRADRIVVEKAARRLTLLRGSEVLTRYSVSLGREPVGHKREEGDGRTPEGRYTVDFKHPRSRFHLALRISYPDAADRDCARRHGVSAGGDIMIHGQPNGLGWLGGWHLRRDWTDGCIAVTNAEIETIWARVGVGTPVEINP